MTNNDEPLALYTALLTRSQLKQLGAPAGVLETCTLIDPERIARKELAEIARSHGVAVHRAIEQDPQIVRNMREGVECPTQHSTEP